MKSLYSSVVGYFFPKTTASIISHFTKMVTELEDLAATKLKEAVAHSDLAEDLYDEGDKVVEAKRAKAEAAYIEALAKADELSEEYKVEVALTEADWEDAVTERDSALAAASKLREAFGGLIS